jgi:hypothetical protein
MSLVEPVVPFTVEPVFDEGSRFLEGRHLAIGYLYAFLVAGGVEFGWALSPLLVVGCGDRFAAGPPGPR